MEGVIYKAQVVCSLTKVCARPSGLGTSFFFLYYVDAHDHAVGPLTIDQMRGLFTSNTVTTDTHVNSNGETAWTLLSSKPRLLAALQPPAGPYHYVDAQGQPQGPLDIDQLHGLFASNTVTADTLVICIGDNDWVLLSSKPRLLAQLS